MFNPEEILRGIRSVHIDSRKVEVGSLFVPIQGEHVNGHEYIEAAFKRGAIRALSERPCPCSEKDEEAKSAEDSSVLSSNASGEIIYVESTRQALKDLAEYYMTKFTGKVVAITGSVGKTSTKDMIASVLSQGFSVLKTEGNYNNELGLPLTVFQLQPHHQVLVLEMGMNHFGELHNLSKIAKPDYCVITNIGEAHLENLGSREGILKAKLEILDFMKEDSLAFFNGDDEYLQRLQALWPLEYGRFQNQPIFFTQSIAQDIVSQGFLGIRFCLKGTEIQLKVPGLHMVKNALVAALLGEQFGLSLAQIKAGLENFTLSKNRMDVVRGRFTVINDSYNASPSSVKAALDLLSESQTRRVCILGDMRELGDDSPALHEEVGAYAAAKGLELIIAVGSLAYSIYKGAERVLNEQKSTQKDMPALTRLLYFETREELDAILLSEVRDGDTILVKASRLLAFEKTAEILIRGCLI